MRTDVLAAYINGERRRRALLDVAIDVLPAITGTPTVGQELTVSTGVWNTRGSQTTLEFTYQWTRDGVDIAGATSAAYTLVMADGGTDVGCIVTAVQPVAYNDTASVAVGPVAVT